MSIVAIDMHIRDERVLEYLRRAAGADGTVHVSGPTLAREFKCHENTARAILHRLRQAGYIRLQNPRPRYGFECEVVQHD